MHRIYQGTGRGLPSNRKSKRQSGAGRSGFYRKRSTGGLDRPWGADHLYDKHGTELARETLRQWMIADKLLRSHLQRVAKVHQWRSRFGDSAQWDASMHAWLEGRGEELEPDSSRRRWISFGKNRTLSFGGDIRRLTSRIIVIRS